ncbi:MAG: hypothetical protein BroJett026_34100 [Betaproteobacteria bacterium]|nr:MAG: hypothetical protein BroJett026_34100 [Betaproteobacteria bacterium]
MITPAYCQLLARYSRWMNERTFALLGRMDDAERKRDRGAFFGSIHRTLNHVLWADGTWLGRFTGAPFGVPAYGADLTSAFDDLAARREAMDRRIAEWAGQVDAAWLDGPLDYRASSDGRRRILPAWIAAVHLFQHATHHRAQVGTMMKQAGVDPGTTDLPFLPDVVRVVP